MLVNNMNRSDTRPISILAQEKLSEYLTAALRPVPLLAGLTGVGLFVIYVMGAVGVLERLGWQLLIAGVMMLIIAVLHRAVLRVAQRGEGARAYVYHALITVFASIGLALLWEGAAPVAILIAWLAPAICIPARVPRRLYAGSILLSLVATLVALWLAGRPLLPRLAAGSSGSVAALLLVASMVILFAMLVLATQAIRYRALETRLVGTLVPIIAVPILLTTTIAAYNAFTTSQQQFVNTLQAVSSLKRSQLDTLARGLFQDISTIQEGSQGAPSILYVLRHPGQDDAQYRLSASTAATQIRNVIVLHPSSDYDEVLVIDKAGNTVLSTYLLNQGLNFGDQDFFQHGLAEPTARFIQYPGNQNASGEFRLVVAAPFHGDTPDEVLGVVVGVARPDAVYNILQPAPGLENVTTSVLSTDLRPVSTLEPARHPLDVSGISAAMANGAGSGSGSFRNAAGIPVLGYYEWDPTLATVLVSEIPQAAARARSLAAVLASGLVGLLTIIIASIAVLSAARAISEPVTGLAQAAEQLASGQLATRAYSDREDEIGRLAESFNSMANQLQSVIGNLEARVADRTRALEAQSLRLRTAAEVARDASLAPTLDELLSRAAQLVLERFGVDHAGIYLLDEKRQFAVLQAAPGTAGAQMLQANYRVFVGDTNAVGQAAETGEAQLFLKPGHGETVIGDPFHLNTRAQLTLPLRTNEGLIGLLDLQSNQANAFTAADTAVIQVLADQLAASIERGRLLRQVQDRLGLLEQTYKRFTEESWGAYTQNRPQALGYTYDNVRMEPVSAIPVEVQKALSASSGLEALSGNGSDGGGQTAYIPVRLRGQTLGVISANFRQSPIPPKTLALLEQAASRLGTALENVRLLEDSLRRASKERMIGEITARISSSISVRNVLQTAVEELGRALPGSDVSINFRPQVAAPEKEGQP